MSLPLGAPVIRACLTKGCALHTRVRLQFLYYTVAIVNSVRRFIPGALRYSEYVVTAFCLDLIFPTRTSSSFMTVIGISLDHLYYKSLLFVI